MLQIYLYEWKMLISPYFLAAIQFPIWLLFLNKTKRIKTLNTLIGTDS